MESGYVKSVRLDKGYFFIGRQGGGDVFCHVSGLSEGLEFNESLQDMRVQFELIETSRGSKAVNVRMAN